MSNRKTSPRSIKLRSLFTGVLKGEKVVDSNNARLLLEAICDQDNRALCIQKIHGSEHGRAAFQSALSSNTTTAFLQTSVTAILRYLAAPELKTLCGGTVLQQFIVMFVEEALVWSAFIEAFKAGELAGDGELAFSWLLLELVSLPKDKAIAFMPLAQDGVIKERLLESTQQEVRLRGQRIMHIVENLTAGHENRMNGPGGRHDNDFSEINKIGILPTSDELAAKDPYLPRAHETSSLALRPDGLAFHLDGQFRLLREDMLREMREEMQIALNMRQGRRKAFSVEHLSMAGVHCDGRNPWALQLRCTNDLPQMPKKNERIRRQFLKDNPKYLKHESLACAVADDEVVTLGTLVREEDLLIKQPPVLCLQIPGADTDRALRRIKGAKNVKLVQLSTALFSYAPILKQLKEIKELPFEDEILRWNADSSWRSPDYQFSAEMTHLVEDLLHDPSLDLRNVLRLPRTTKLDKSQAACFVSGIRQRLSIIQGPPAGTGKSFSGALLAKAIYRHSDEKILILTYKHHALNQFLEDVIALGIPRDQIVRLGSSRKASPSVQDLSMKDAASQVKLTREQCDILDLIKRKATDDGESLQRAFSSLEQAAFSKYDILEHLEFLTEGPPFFSAFEMPTRSDGTVQVGKRGKAMDSFYLLDRWCRGKDASPFKREAAQYPEVWNIKASDRLKLQQTWKAEILKDRLDAVRLAGLCYNEDLEQIASIYMERELTVLRARRIIACTTTAAAKYVQCLNSVSPGVVIAEEAGEILESHILTALGPDTKQLILIGDHKQLRPKVDYALSVERGNGYDLNRSLFERLVLRGYPHHCLQQQHRMRPELAEFVRQLTYANLVDANTTKNRQSIKGLQDNIIFLNHNHNEEEVKDVRDWKDGTSPSTKKNLFEIQMAVKCMRYLSQQDLNMPTEKIVILTPYLGQLHLLRDELSKDNDPILNDLDSHDLVRAGLVPAATAQVNKQKIRISTIGESLSLLLGQERTVPTDNFQGDESEIVIVSLTRSNSNGDIGFMSSPERLNVLLSRARNGLILIGNAETFMDSKRGGELWKRFIGMLKAKKHIYDGLPVKCEQHPTRLTLLRSPEDFDKECPDGGCKEPCGSFLKCGVHKCPRNCHHRSDHSKMDCEKIVEFKCSAGHVQKRKCHQAQPQTCKICESEDERSQKTLERDVELQDRRLRAQAKHDLEIADLDMQIRKIREDATDRQTALEREHVLKQKKRDLEAAQRQAAQSSQQASQKASQAAQHSKPASSESNTELEHSFSELEWARQKRVEGASNAAIDDLMGLTGLEAVKGKFLDIKAKIETVERQGIDMKKERMGMVMLGNPGTGKTTVARIYARFLASVGALPGKEFVEITGSGLANEGVPGAKKLIDGLVKAGGGVFFIDEAYQLASGNNLGGKNVLDFILAEIEERRGTVAFIIAGYTKEMEKFFEHNPGFDSRMPHRLHFADYTDKELLVMLNSMIERKYGGRASLEDGGHGLYARILIKRLGRKRGTEGYGNARALENVWGRVTECQASRLRKERVAGGSPDDFLFTKGDLIGREPTGAIKESGAWNELHSLIGLEKVKDSVKVLVDALQRNYQRELRELEPLAFTLHRVFLGSPGTGKTTVAKLYGSILADLGLLSKREVITKQPADFIGAALGQSEENTKNILKATEGKVLVIDEAYDLDAGGRVGGGNPDPFKTAVIDTIVAEVQNTPGEDRCVLMLGYKEQMEDMMNHSNPGLARRFRLSDAFYFDDFNDADLFRVLDLKLQKQGFKATDEAKRVAIEVLARDRDRPNFGNAGAVENLLSRAKELEQKRTSAAGAANFDPEITFLPQDFDEDYDRVTRAKVSCRELFADIVGCEKLIDQLETYQRIAKNMKAHGKDPRTQIPFNFIFKGPPGTGKTTVARKISQLYYQMGILGTSDYVDCSASDLIGQYVGHTGPKTKGKLTEALGRVLFVDEAYRFCDGGFGKEAVNELVDSLTKPKFMGKVVVVLAGYTEDMDELLRINPGLSSRFPEEVVFENMAPEKCLELLEKEIKKEEIDITPSIDNTARNEYQQMLDIFTELSKLPSWGNGRDVKNIAKSICSEALASTTSSGLTVNPADIIRNLDKILKSQKARNRDRKNSLNPGHGFQSFPLPTLTQDPPKAPINKTSAVKRTKTADPIPMVEEEPPIELNPEDFASSSMQRDPGVSGQVWQQLQKNIAAEKALKDAEQAFIAAQQREHQAQKEAEEARLEEIRKLEEEERLAENNRRKEIEEELRQEKQRIEAARQAMREAEEKLKKAQEEAERKRKQEEAIQKKIRDMGICPAGYRWFKGGGGYRCGGGSHFMSNTQLGI
ncbi:P-loop containing nucleoside triphosphate hydrolase protein [Zopfia rhizophila CBS 207.26]|uniref:P-loop containing nucleoside triphosphate hydrolase protein n=1 Tax=Zopfia rhizophila CBS 207.26 TaxID=1314779 RepID=A0A6A6DKA4_9PEZI|nr:P-loop containing nucleoside triphosphate hydrolase protein [Zopfia rhizophila CBS 207.26]